MNVVLEVMLDEELELEDYLTNFRRMFGDTRMDAVLGSVDGSVRFYGLTPTSMKLEGLDRHLRLIESYKNCMQLVLKPWRCNLESERKKPIFNRLFYKTNFYFRQKL